MQKTENYNLNKPEAADPIRVADFNENSDIIDAVLGTCGNCKITTGFYIGDGTYGEENPVTLSFDFIPKMVFVRNVNGYTPYAILYPGKAETTFLYGPLSNTSIHLTWSANMKTVSWYTGSAERQLNVAGAEYSYFALG